MFVFTFVFAQKATDSEFSLIQKLLIMNQSQQERGSGVASAFGGTGNNTNASAGYLNGNNSVANSNTNYAASFSLCYNDCSSTLVLDRTTPDSVVSKTEKIATIADIQKAAIPESKSTSEMKLGKETLPAKENIPFLAENRCEQSFSCMDYPTENREVSHFNKGITTLNKHKRLRNLKAFLVNEDLIREAIKEAQEGKKPTRELIWISHHVEETAKRIRKELLEGTYVPKPYRFRTIHNKDEKPRHLAILGFYDRCVQQVLKKVIQQKLRALEPRNVYSNLLGRGTLSNDARYCLYQQLRHEVHVAPNGFGLKMDIHHCYESISTDVIERELFKYVTDAFARRLIHRMFAHIHYLPIGDPLSGLYVNLVLRQWHKHLLEEKHDLFDSCYFFCDDALFINKTSKEKLHQLCQDARQWLPKYANLHIKKNYKVFRLAEGFVFCGAKVFPTKILVRQLVKKRMLRAKNKPRSLASYKGILDKTSSAHLSAVLQMKDVPDKVRKLNRALKDGS